MDKETQARNKLAEDKLKELGIEYQTVEHAPAVTIELADEFIEGVPGVRTKTMFVTDRKKRAWFLLITDEFKRVDMKRFGDLAGVKGVKMASEESLFEKMKLPPMVVSPFGLLFDEAGDIQVIIDREIIGEERMSFHPNTNEKTIFLKTEDVLRYLEAIGHPASVEEL